MTNSLTRRAFLAAGIFTLGAIGGGEAAHAQAGGPKADVLVIHASKEATASTDPKLANLRRLQNVPFDKYNVFKLLDTKSVPLSKTASSVSLPNGDQFGLALDSVKDRQLFIKPSLSNTELPPVTATAEQPFFIAGRKHGNGILIIAVTPHL